ncbi:MAG: ATP-binding protein, partial [Deltaproteobacteria bacterium]
YSRDELLGRSMSLIFPAYDSMVVSSAFHDTPPPSRREIDCVYRTKEGKDLPVLFTHSLLRNRSGEIEGAICVALDIRKKKREEAEKERLQQQLHQAKKMESIGTLAAGIAHDFNNLLTAILGFTDLARERVGNDHPIVEDLDQVRDTGRRATELVRQILAFGRETKQEKGPIQVQTLVKEILKLLRSSIPTNIEIEQRLDAEEIFIIADPSQIQQLVMNLCRNAAQALEASGGKLQVGLEAVDLTDDETHPEGLKPGCYLRIIVSDTGPGMDEATLARIYDPFFTTKEVGKATGLGLSVVHGIIKAHNGTISVQSKPGQGTTFTIYLPAQPSAPTSILQPRPPLPLGKKERILAVDDEQAISMFLSQMLPEIGYQATVFSDSEEALAAFRADPYSYDLVLTDQAMPGLQGTSLAKVMLRLRPDLPII